MKFKSIAITFFISATVLCLGAAFVNSAKLVNDFEKTVESKDFTPEAESIELAEIDRNSHRGWKIKAERSTGDSNLEIVNAQNVEAEIFDENDKVKMLITAERAKINRATGVTILEGRPKALMVEKNTALVADQMIIKKGQPIDALGNVKVLLKPDGSNCINAQKAIITQAMDDITLYTIAQSPVSDNMLLSGGVMRIEHGGQGKDSKPRKIIISNGAWVKSGTTTCQSSHLDVFLDEAGNASLAIFTGSPVANQNGKIIHASKIEYTVSNGKVKASGSVQSNFI